MLAQKFEATPFLVGSFFYDATQAKDCLLYLKIMYTGVRKILCLQ